MSYANVRGPGAREAWRARMHAEAADWFSRDDAGVPYSFTSLCHALDLDPSALCAALADDRRRRSGGHMTTGLLPWNFDPPSQCADFVVGVTWVHQKPLLGAVSNQTHPL